MTDPTKFSSYAEAQAHQLNEWIDGRPWHNPYEPDGSGPHESRRRGECCPDFSCCQPHMLIPREARVSFAEAGEDERAAMMGVLLIAALGDAGVEVESALPAEVFEGD